MAVETAAPEAAPVRDVRPDGVQQVAGGLWPCGSAPSVGQPVSAGPPMTDDLDELLEWMTVAYAARAARAARRG